jgi:hypothetical protein
VKAEIFYIPNCPNLPTARRQVERLLAEHGVRCSIDEVEVGDRDAAERLGFVGSPTIRIDGEDVATPLPGARTAFACRTYEAEGRLSGIPPDGLVRVAIRRALGRGRES